MESVSLNYIRLDISSTLRFASCWGNQTDMAPRWFVQIMLEEPDTKSGDGSSATEVGRMEFLMVDDELVGHVFDSLTHRRPCIHTRFGDP
jgi:hypothetical protein